MAMFGDTWQFSQGDRKTFPYLKCASALKNDCVKITCSVIIDPE